MRWTENNDEIRHLVSIQEELFTALSAGHLIEVTISNGRTFEGLLSNQSSGNNGVPVSSFYGNLTLTRLNNQKVEIDLLDVKKITNVTTKEKLLEYEQAGIITIVDYPTKK